jgi:hypothetical protein
MDALSSKNILTRRANQRYIPIVKRNIFRTGA